MHRDYCIPLLAGRVPQPPGTDDFFGPTSSEGEDSSQGLQPQNEETPWYDLDFLDPDELLPKSSEGIERYSEVRRYADSKPFLTIVSLQSDPNYRRLLKALRSQQVVDSMFEICQL